MQRDVLHERPELIGVGDEVRLAVHFDQHADRVVEVDVGVDQALIRRSAGSLRGARQALLAQMLDGTIEVTVGLDQRALAVHHAGAGRVAERLDLRRGDIGHADGSSTGGSTTTGSSARAGASGSNTFVPTHPMSLF